MMIFLRMKPAKCKVASIFWLQWEPCGESCPLMKFHSHEELISDLESIQDVATDQFAEIFCLTDDVSIP